MSSRWVWSCWSSFISCEMPCLNKLLSFDASRSLLLTCLPSISCIMLHLCAFVLFSLSLISYFSLYRYLAFPLLSLSLHLPSCGPSWRAFWRFSAGGKAFWKATKGFKNKFGIFLILMSPEYFPARQPTELYMFVNVCVVFLYMDVVWSLTLCFRAEIIPNVHILSVFCVVAYGCEIKRPYKYCNPLLLYESNYSFSFVEWINFNWMD